MKRHELDVFSLVSGLVFAAVAVVYLVAAATDSEVEGRWVIPLALIALGVGGAGRIRRPRPAQRSRIRHQRRGQPPAGIEPPADTGETLADTLRRRSEPARRDQVTEPIRTTSDGPATRGE